MQKNTMEQTNAAGTTTRYVEETTGLPAKYVLGAVVGVVGLVLLLKGNKNGKPSFFGKYITPLIMAAAYKKVMEVVEGAVKSPAKEEPAVA